MAEYWEGNPGGARSPQMKAGEPRNVSEMLSEIDSKLTAAKQEWMDEAMKRVAEALKAASFEFEEWLNSSGHHFGFSEAAVASRFLSPPVPTAVPSVDWHHIATTTVSLTSPEWSALHRYVEYMRDTPGAKVVVEPRDEP